MEDLLYLAHRIPYPPNKGDKIRSYHLLKYLSQHYRVHLGTFVDTEDDWQYANNIRAWCDEVCLIKLDPKIARLRCFSGFMTGNALTLPFYWDRQLKQWVDDLFTTKSITKIVVFSAAMTQYVRHIHSARRVIDFVDIDSDKWKQYAQTKSWPLSWIYKREAELLLNYEKAIAQEFDKSTFVSIKEATFFKMLTPETADKVDYFNNGVDVDYFSPIHQLSNPYAVNDRILVFTGAMDYWANIDAVEWFAQKIFPAVRSQIADTQFYIVGSNPTTRVKALTKIPGVTVTGRVEDVRPYLKYASMAVAPLRIARGIQNKVLEAMAMGKTVVLSPQAMEGIQAIDGEELYVAADEKAFAGTIINLFAKAHHANADAARARILSDYTWPASLARFDQLLMST